MALLFPSTYHVVLAVKGCACLALLRPRGRLRPLTAALRRVPPVPGNSARFGLEHEVFAVIHLDAQNRVIEYVEMIRGTVSQTSVYPREAVKESLARNSAALLLVHNHPSGDRKSVV